MNLKMYSRALRVRRMGSHCSPRLDTSRYLFNTDISFLEGNDKRERERCFTFILIKLTRVREGEDDERAKDDKKENE